MKSTKKSLVASGLSLLACCALLAGTTFAWFTDNVTNKGNKIEAGTLEVSFAEWDGTKGGYVPVGEEPIFNYDLWEPGYTDIAAVKIGNEGTLALKYKLEIIANGATDLAKAIDVYYYQGGNALNGLPKDFAALKADGNYTNLGTLDKLLADEDNNGVANGHLEAGEADFAIIALHMQETAGNEFQGKSIGGTFDIVLNATQYSSENEKDGFGDKDYDADAPVIKFDGADGEAAFREAVAALNEGEILEVSGTLDLTEPVTIDKDAVIRGADENAVIQNKNNDDKDLLVVQGNGLHVTFENIKLDNAYPVEGSDAGPYNKGSAINASSCSNTTLTLNNVDILYHAFNGWTRPAGEDIKDNSGVLLGSDVYSDGYDNNTLVINDSTIKSNHSALGTDTSYASAVEICGYYTKATINNTTIEDGMFGVVISASHSDIDIRDTKITATVDIDINNTVRSSITVDGCDLTTRCGNGWADKVKTGCIVIRQANNAVSVTNTKLGNYCYYQGNQYLPIVSFYGTNGHSNVVDIDKASFDSFAENKQCPHCDAEFITNCKSQDLYPNIVRVDGVEQKIVKK